MFMFGPYQIVSRVGLFCVLAHSIWTLVKHFVFEFELYEKWVFSQVLRFSLELAILIFESPIQSGRSSSHILEPPLSGVLSSYSTIPPNEILQFFLYSF